MLVGRGPYERHLDIKYRVRCQLILNWFINIWFPFFRTSATSYLEINLQLIQHRKIVDMGFSILMLAWHLQDYARRHVQLWQYGLWSFQTGYTKLERFLPKNQHIQRKFLNFEIWTNGEVSKSAKSPNLPTFKVNFLYQKLSESFSIFFSVKNINLGACFLLLTFFEKFNF